MSRKLSLEELIDALKKGNDFQNIECDWSELDGRDWSWFLSTHPQFADKCDWSKLGGRDWSWLLSKQPQFADKCDWEKLGGDDWCWVLYEQPQFADKCDWKKLDGEDWSRLLSKQPQFADKCDWEKLDGGDWGHLLRKQLLFADKCDWGKLNGWDWSLLLSHQPQFADKCDWKKLNSHLQKSLITQHPELGGYATFSDLDNIPLNYVSDKGTVIYIGKENFYSNGTILFYSADAVIEMEEIPEFIAVLCDPQDDLRKCRNKKFVLHLKDKKRDGLQIIFQSPRRRMYISRESIPVLIKELEHIAEIYKIQL